MTWIMTHPFGKWPINFAFEGPLARRKKNLVLNNYYMLMTAALVFLTSDQKSWHKLILQIY